MSSHPNAILLLALTPGGNGGATIRAGILAEMGVEDEEESMAEICIAGQDYFMLGPAEEDFDDYAGGMQISLPAGSIGLFRLITYGYGEKIKWDALAKEQGDLAEWAAGACERYTCTHEIFVTANYW